ncbi:hypothetical protein [Promicromonospora sp. NPDC050880]|uniref:hypothetical protein n=1 Tax=Promicromonospora sp. NPDC050880 TaxID=3364406 RepID=UPI0037942683
MMTNFDALAAIRRFFSVVECAGLILPSGWFGRPYDNLMQLTRGEASEDSLLLELDGQLILKFAGRTQVASTDRGLQIGGFAVLSWDWTEFGSASSHREEFDSGAVELVGPMG